MEALESNVSNESDNNDRPGQNDVVVFVSEHTTLQDQRFLEVGEIEECMYYSALCGCFLTSKHLFLSPQILLD